MKRMPDLSETVAWLIELIRLNWPSIYAAGLAFFIAALRVKRAGGTAGQMLLEAMLCGAITLAASNGLQLFSIPHDTAPFFGGVIGMLGVEFIRAHAKNVFKKKADQL